MSHVARTRRITGLAALCCAVAFIGQAAYIPLKAELAQVLMSRAYEAKRTTGHAKAPWPGADLTVEGRLSFDERDQSHFIVSGASGRSLAFGPGRELRSAPIGAPGVSVVGGHRDTHFAVLEHVRIGEVITAEDGSGAIHRYRVTARRVVDKRDRSVAAPTQTAQNRLVLVTCYPFDAVAPGGDLRFVVVADEVGRG